MGSISSVFASKYSKAGISIDRDLEGRDLGTRPVHLMYAMAKPGVDAAPRYYALWLCAAAEPGLQRVTFFTDLFAGGPGWVGGKRTFEGINRMAQHASTHSYTCSRCTLMLLY